MGPLRLVRNSRPALLQCATADRLLQPWGSRDLGQLGQGQGQGQGQS